MNTQPIEKAIAGNELSLNVVDVFATIQGKGPHSGPCFAHEFRCRIVANADSTAWRDVELLGEVL